MTGFLAIPEADYHADRVSDEPTLSATLAKLLLEKSPLHAWTCHPKLNPAWTPEQDDPKYDVGNASHALILEGRENAVHVVHEDTWRKNSAKEAREYARSIDKIPLLASKWDEVVAMSEAVRKQIAELDIDPLPFTDGQAEVTLSWHEPDGTACRSRIDWLHEGNGAICDLKTTTRSANPNGFDKTIYTMGYDVQAEFHSRGVERLTGIRPEWRFIVVETQPPYGLSVVSLAPAGWELAKRKVDRALEVWAECLRTNVWPSYPTKVAFAEPPAWAEYAWLEREAREAREEMAA